MKDFAVCKMWLKTVLIFCLFVTSLQFDPRSGLRRCQKEDQACYDNNANLMYKATVLAEPAWNITSLDPMPHKVIEGDLLIISYKLRDSIIEGYKDCHVVHATLDDEMSIMGFKLRCPLLLMYGKYEIEGQLISIPIDGVGDYVLECRDYYINVDTHIKFRDETKRYISIKKYKAFADLRGGMDANLSNLFNGNEELARPVRQFIKDNWKPIASLLQGPVIKASVKKVVKNMNKLLTHVPFDIIVSY